MIKYCKAYHKYIILDFDTFSHDVSVDVDRKRPQNTAYLEFPRNSNLVIFSQNCHVILQVGGVFSDLINYSI